MRIFKSDTGVPSVTWNDCVIESIASGWIDGQMKPFDDMSYLQHSTSRKVNSNWSAKNCRHATTLIAEGRMLPAGLAQVEAAKSDGRWDTAYAGSADMTIPQDFLTPWRTCRGESVLRDARSQKSLFNLPSPSYSEEAETRARRIAQIVAKLDRGEVSLTHAASRSQCRGRMIGCTAACEAKTGRRSTISIRHQFRTG